MKAIELNNLPSTVLLVWDIGCLVVDGNGQYCPNCYTDRLFDSNNLCVTCGGDPPSEDFFAEDFEDEGFAYQQTKLYDLIGKLSELTEEQAKGLVKQVDWYYNYKHPIQTRRIMFYTALESFHSAIEASGYYAANPVKPSVVEEGKLPKFGSAQPYIEAQRKTLPQNTLIFKKS